MSGYRARDRAAVRDATDERQRDEAVNLSPPGQAPIVLAGLAIGILLLAIQLWLLTIALELYLAGEGGRVWQTALASGAIFLGGLLMLRLLRRRAGVRRTPRVGAAQTRA